MNITKVFTSFFIIVIITVSGALYTLFTINKIQTNTQKMYTHPFQVSNAVANIQTAVVTIHRNMKDVVLKNNDLEIIKLIESIQSQEHLIYENFDLVYKNYLGDKKDIDKSFNVYKQWKPIREKVIQLVYNNKLNDAKGITQHEGAQHIEKLYVQIEVLKQYAYNKAEEFYNASIDNNAVNIVITIFILTLFISSGIIIFVVKNLLEIVRKNKEQLHLIDQNISTVTINLNKKITHISNALCYKLNKQKKDLLYTKSDFFFLTKEQFESFESKIYSAKEHKCEVYIQVADNTMWFYIEIFPQLDKNYELVSFNIFLTDISDKKKIEEVSITDTLTTLYNRNYFEMILDKEVKRSKRDSKALSMIMFDVDYFKQFNDTYGHHDGDRALKEVAKILLSHTNRSYDYAFRVGGEEFIIITYQDDLESLKVFTKNILDDIRALKISHKNSDISKYLTSSAGAVRFSKEHLLNTDEMYKKVDSLLYEAKRTGRDKVIAQEIK